MAAAMKARAPPKQAAGEVELLVLYGSQTGNAMEIAKSINAEALSRGMKTRVFAMNDYSLSKLAAAQVVVIVVSSTGDGDAPDNCDVMVSAIRRKSHSPTMLGNLHYTVCGLGDQNYTRFMAVPRVFTGRLPELGAKCFYKCCEADEVDGLEEIVDQWTDGLWGPLEAALKAAAGGAAAVDGAAAVANGHVQSAAQQAAAEEEINLVGVPPLQPSRVTVALETSPGGAPSAALAEAHEGGGAAAPSYSAHRPYMAAVTDAKYMTAEWSDRKVIHLEVDVEGSGISVGPGDSIGIVAVNDEAIVDALLERLGVDGSKFLRIEGRDGGLEGAAVLGHIRRPCTLREALLRHCDVTAAAKKGLLRVLAEYCSAAGEKTRLLLLSSRGGKDAYKAEVLDARPGLLDLLRQFPSCRPDLGHLLDSLPPLVPRFYSITNSPRAAGGGAARPVQVAFSVVSMQLGPRTFHGVCTSWLDRALQLGAGGGGRPPAALRLPIFPKGGGDFRPPADLSASVIMIGPGTGVAPFRGFLQDRAAALAARAAASGPAEEGVGESWLFFGCRRRDEDYLYGADLEAFAATGTLSRLVVAFSRKSDQKVYVQHKLKEHGSDVAKILLRPNAYVFVCGDGANMAKDVHAALISILGEHADKKESLAIAHLSDMMQRKRYVRDIWS